MKDNVALRREYPGFIREEDESKWPVRGPAAEKVGFVPEGWTPEQVLSGEYHRYRMAHPDGEVREIEPGEEEFSDWQEVTSFEGTPVPDPKPRRGRPPKGQ